MTQILSAFLPAWKANTGLLIVNGLISLQLQEAMVATVRTAWDGMGRRWPTWAHTVSGLHLMWRKLMLQSVLRKTVKRLILGTGFDFDDFSTFSVARETWSRHVWPYEGWLSPHGRQPEIRHVRSPGHGGHVRSAPCQWQQFLFPNVTVTSTSTLASYVNPGPPPPHDDGARGPGNEPPRNVNEFHSEPPSTWQHGQYGSTYTGHSCRVDAMTVAPHDIKTKKY